MAAREIDWLRETIGAILIPELETRGFGRIPLTQEETRSEIGAACPFGRLCRAGPTGIEPSRSNSISTDEQPFVST
jgi:hypothetical protein